MLRNKMLQNKMLRDEVLQDEVLEARGCETRSCETRCCETRCCETRCCETRGLGAVESTPPTSHHARTEERGTVGMQLIEYAEIVDRGTSCTMTGHAGRRSGK